MAPSTSPIPDYQLGNRTSETGKKGIYRVSPAGTVIGGRRYLQRAQRHHPLARRNVLYVADYAGNVVRTFAVAADGSTSGRKDFTSVSSPDGFAMDCWATCTSPQAPRYDGGLLAVGQQGRAASRLRQASATWRSAGRTGRPSTSTPQGPYSLDMNLPATITSNRLVRADCFPVAVPQ